MTRELLDIILKHLRTLKALGRPTDYWDDLIIHLIICKLDVVTSKAWELSIKGKELPDLKSLIEFLMPDRILELSGARHWNQYMVDFIIT